MTNASELVADFIGMYSSEVTKAQYSRSIRILREWCSANHVEPTKLSIDDGKALYDYLLVSGKLSYGHQIAVFFSYLKERGVYQVSPFKGLQFRGEPKKQTKRDIPTDQEIENVLELAEPLDAAVILILIEHGIRINLVPSLLINDGLMSYIYEGQLYTETLSPRVLAFLEKARSSYANPFSMRDRQSWVNRIRYIFKFFYSKQIVKKIYSADDLRFYFGYKHLLENGGDVRALGMALKHSSRQSTRLFLRNLDLQALNEQALINA